MTKQNVLVIAPHMDDEVLGCGGVICKHKSVGDTVTVIFVAHRIYGHRFNKERNKIQKQHALKAKKVLGYDTAIFLSLNDEKLDGCLQDIIIPLERHVDDLKPNVVYLPFREDNNQDHRAVFDAARVVFRPAATPFVKEINMYEVSSSTEQSPPLLSTAFLPNYYVAIRRYIDQKISGLACYETENKRYPHPRSEKALKALAQKRGVEIGFEYAEAFVNIRRKWE